LPTLTRRPTDEDLGTTLARCIVLVDDLRAYRRKDLGIVDAQFAPLKKSRLRDIYDLWIRVKPAAQQIVNMPLKVSGVDRMIRTVDWLRLVNKIFLVFLVVFVALEMVPAWGRALGLDITSGTGLILTVIFVLLVVITLNLVSFFDYTIRKRIVSFEEAKMDEYAPARERMKESVNKMMKALAGEMGKTDKDPDYYALVLHFDDYDNIEVVAKWRPRSMLLFRKPYNHYQVVPKP
jgi:hypothetical protein